jgi:hypothetical protein
MRGEPTHPAFVQLGNYNTQHNHYYLAAEASSQGAAALGPNVDLQHFTLVAQLGSKSPKVAVVNVIAEEMNRRASRPSSPVSDFLLCRRLAPVIAEHGDWQLRRAFSHSLAFTLASFSSLDDVAQRILGELLDYARASSNFSVILSIASTAGSSTATLFADRVRDIYEFTHPQVLWQQSRNPSLSVTQNGLRPLIDAVLGRDDPWVRRRLVSSCLLHASRQDLGTSGEITRLLTALSGDDLPYVRLVLDWIDPLGRLDVPNALSPRLKKALQQRKLPPAHVNLESLPIADPRLVRKSLETLSLDLDMKKMSAAMGPNLLGIGGSSKGRYSTIEDAIAYVLASVPSELREDLVLELLSSFDEGIRWAVAAQFDLGLPRAQIRDTESGQVFRMLADQHPWVIREAFTTLTRSDLSFNESNSQRLAATAIAAVGRASTQGWPRSELMPVVAGLVASVPAVAEHIELTILV